MIRFSLLLLSSLLLAQAPTEASAQAVANNVKVASVRADASGKGYVKFETDLAGAPATCTSIEHKRMLAFDLNTEGGKGVMSIALAAKAADRPVYAKGTGTCTVWGTVESWYWGEVR